MPKLVSVVFSFCDEEESIPELIRRVTAALEPEDHEIIFVNDDSTDRSLDLLVAANRTDPRVKIVNMARRFGVCECILAGMAHASGDAVVYMDSDLQDPPETIPKLLEKWREGAEVVYTVRESREGESRFRMAMTKLAYRLIKAVSEVPAPVEAGDFRLLSRRAADEVLKFRETEPYLRGWTMWIGFNRAVVPYVRSARAAGTTHFPGTFSRSALRTFLAGVTSLSMAPLFAIPFIGAAVTGISALALIAVLAGLPAPENAGLVLFLLLLWGATLIALGVIAVYLSRVLGIVRRRPLYIVKDTVGLQRPGR